VATVFRAGGALRRILGWSVVAAAVAAILWSRRLDWGMAPIVWVPAAVAACFGVSLTGTRSLRLEDAGETLVVTGRGLLRAPARRVPLAAECRIERVPTMGLEAVVLHHPGGEQALGTWLTAARAEALIAWLEVGMGRTLERREPVAHRLDV